MDKKMITPFKRFMSVLLCIAMVLPMLVVPVGAEEAAYVDEPLAVLFATSDFQRKVSSTDGSNDFDGAVKEMNEIIREIKDDYSGMDGAFFLGDYTTLYTQETTEQGLAHVQNVLNSAWGLNEEDVIHVQGNHDPFVTGMDTSGGHEFEYYNVFVIHNKDFPWCQGGKTGTNDTNKDTVQNTAKKLEAFLKDKADKNDNRPVFITSHVPLHYSKRSTSSGQYDNTYAKYIFDVVKKYGDDLNIIFMFGHNHSQNYDNYLGGAAIYLPEGSNILIPKEGEAAFASEPLNFTYMNAGYVGYYGGDCETQLSSTVIEIYENRIEIARYDKDGEANLKDEGIADKYVTTADTNVYTNSSPEATIARKNVDVHLDYGALRSGKLYKNGSAVLTVKGEYNVPYSVVWSSSNPALATVIPAGNGMSALVTGVAKGDVKVTATITEKGTGTVIVRECNFEVLDTASTEPEVLIAAGNHTYFQKVDSLSAGKVYAFIDKEDDGYWIGRQMALQYTAAGDAKENDEVGAHPENEFNAYPVDVFQLPIGNSVLTLSNISDATCWWRTSTHTNGLNVFTDNQYSGKNRYLFVSEDENSSSQFKYNNYDPDQDRLRAKGSEGHGWSYDANHGLVSSRIGTYMKYALYYSQKDTDFSVYRYNHAYYPDGTIKQEDEGANSRVYAFEQKTISISSDITAYLKDTVGYVNKDVGYDDASGLRLGGAQTGDVIVINNGTKTVEIPVTIDMIRGSLDVTKPGVYSDLSICYAGKTIAEGAYTLVVKDTATILHNEAAREYMDTIYARVEQMVSGRQYMIVDTGEAGIAHAMGVSRNMVFAYNVLAQQLPVDGAEQVFIDSTRYSWDGSKVTSADITASDLIGRGIEDQGNINEFFKDTFADRTQYQYAIRLVWTPTQMMYTAASTSTGKQPIKDSAYYFLVSQMQEAGRNANKVLSISANAVDTQLSLLTAPKTSTSITSEWWYHWKYNSGIQLNSSKVSNAYLFYNFQNMIKIPDTVNGSSTVNEQGNKDRHDSLANQNFQVKGNHSTYTNMPALRRTWIYERVTDIDTVSARVSDKTATVTQRVEDKYESTSGATFTGDYILVDTTHADGTVTTEQVPMTIDMLTGGFDLTKPGTYSNLNVTYQGVEICSDYTLNIVAFVENHYPEFPEEGAVRIGKYLNMGTYNYLDTGVASIDLFVTGIPAQSGVDLVIILDTSSSMTDCIHAVDNGSICSLCQGSQDLANSQCHTLNEKGVCTVCEGSTKKAVTSCHSVGADGICTKCNGIKITAKNSRLSALEDTLQNMFTTLQKPINGYIPDIDVAVATFNGYTPINTDYSLKYDSNRIEQNHQVTEDKPDGSQLLLPFTNVAEVEPGCLNGTPGEAELTVNSGTNYDRAIELAYDMLSAKQKQNAMDGVSRQPVVVFMSDGAPFQYNYFVGASNQDYWNKYLAGTLTKEDISVAVNSQGSAVLNAFEDYYNGNGTGNKHWMAEAIKADPNSLVKVIDPDAMTRNHVTYARGLGATLYSIGFGMAPDVDITLDTIHSVMANIATDNDHYLKADSYDALNQAFQKIADLVRSGSAKDAVYHDQMGVDFDLVTSNIVGGDKKIKLNPAPSITVKRYDLYKPSEVGRVIDNVTVTNLLVGERKFTLNGENRVENAPTILEKVTFNDDGSEAYSDKKSGNILNKMVIEAATFYYNTDKVASHDITVNNKVVSLAPETFYWIVGDVPQDELVMSYNVYLTDSMEGAREKGTYNTNNYAYLTYVNYLGKACDQSVPTPKLPWKQGIVGYAFYLVDKNGNPIVNQTTGELGSFERSVEITQPEYIEFFWNDENNEGCTVKAEEVSKILPAGYTLFDKSAEYKVTLHSNGSGTYSVKKGSSVDRATTYIQGIHEHDINPVGEYSVGVSEYDTANTIVWFAVYADPSAKPDSVVIDYGIPVDIHVMVNDPHMNTNYAELIGIGAVTETAFSIDLESGFGLSCEGKFGTIKIVDTGSNSTSRAALRYTLNKEYGMQMTKAEQFSYAVKYFGPHGKVGYYYATITIIPAANMYYEDSFLDFEDSTVTNENNQNFGKWETDAAVIQVSCYNENSWNQVYAYCEGDSGAAGIWPGVKMHDTNNDGIYTAFVSADRVGKPVIFNNGDQGNATGDLQLVGNAIYKLDGSWVQNGNYESKVYFTNDSGWAHVYAYWWNGSKNNGWPGTEPTQDADGRYVATVPAGMTGIIFNNGNGGEGNQTSDLVVEENRVYNADGTFEYLSNNLATKRVYFDTEVRDWENVYAYWWKYSGENNVWPGTPMTYQKETGLYYIDIPADMTNIKFHDNKDGYTETLTEQIINGANMYYRAPHWDYSSDTTDVIFNSTGSGWDVVYAYYWSGFNTSMAVWPGVRMTKGEGNLWTLKIPAEAEYIIFNGGLSQTQTWDIPLESSGTTYYFDGTNNNDSLADRVYYFKGDDWDQVYAYYWNGSGETADNGGKAWPGTQMTKDEVTGLYSITVPAEMRNIIFNNNAGQQTGDLRLPTEGSIFYGDAWNACDVDPAIQQEDRPGSASDALKNFDADNVYGYDELYGIFTSHSMGSAQKVTVDAITGHKNVAPKATFFFTGTGFDVVSITDNRSGAVMVEVFNPEGVRVRSTIVTNYYGYTYENGEWVVKNDASDCLYQVPVVKMTGLDYGTYQVVIRAAYMPSMDAQSKGSYTIWLDAIRTYNPAVEDDTSNDAYDSDNEANPALLMLRDILVKQGSFDTGNITGAAFIDGFLAGGIPSVEQYANQGPNNEVYLTNGQAIAFELVTNTNVQPTAVHIGAKLAAGNKVTLKVNNGELAKISSASNMFYALDIDWTQTADGKWSSGTIVVSCEADAGNILSLTDMKVTSTNGVTFAASTEENADDVLNNASEPVVLALTRRSTMSDVRTMMRLSGCEHEWIGGNCTTPKTCSKCGETEGDVVHNFNSYHVCKQCLSLQPGHIAGIYGFNVSLGGNISVNYYVKLDDAVITDPDAKMVFGVPESGGFYTVEVPVSEARLVSGFYVFTCEVAAKEITSDIQAQIVTSDASSDVMYYQIMTYAQSVLANPGKYANEVSLVKALLNYSAAAQIYLDHNTDNLANATEYMSTEDKVLADVDLSDYAYTVSGEQAGVSFYGANLSLESETAIKLYFTIEGDASTLAMSVNGTPVTAEKNGSYYVIKISDIAAHQLGNMYEIKVGGLTLRYGAFSYGNKAMSGSNEKLKDTIRALYAYYMAAVDYQN